MAKNESWKVGSREKKCIDRAVKLFADEVEKRLRDKSLMTMQDIEATVWLFESLMWRKKKTSLRLFMVDLVAHIVMTDKKLSTRKAKHK